MKHILSFTRTGEMLLLHYCQTRFHCRSKKKGYGNLSIYKKKYQLKLIKNLKVKYLRSWWIKSLKEILKINFPGEQGQIKPVSYTNLTLRRKRIVWIWVVAE